MFTIELGRISVTEQHRKRAKQSAKGRWHLLGTNNVHLDKSLISLNFRTETTSFRVITDNRENMI